MVFSGITFLYYFLPCVLLLYFLVPEKGKNAVLLAASLFFYAWGEPGIVLLMLLTIVVSYILGILTEMDPSRKKYYLLTATVFCLGILGYYKYADFFIKNLNTVTGWSIALLRVGLPVGISFYMFQVLSYNIDVYRGNVSAQKNFLNLAAYIAMFPQLVAGPIVRYQDVAVQLEKRTHGVDKFAFGMRRFVYGLSKKVLLANTLGELCTLYQQSNEKSVLFCWLYACAFSLQIYFDFSGYSDMAIGLGKMMGFELMENFNYPFIAKSMTEFWRRWHISLGSWFRDYVYIPMGGSRVCKTRMYFNLIVVWSLTGLWHGAAWNFVLWGLFFAVFLIIEKAGLLKMLEQAKIWNHVYVLLLIMISFVLFNAGSAAQAWQDVGGMFGMQNLPLITKESWYYLRSYAWILLISMTGATPLPKILAASMKWIAWTEPFVLAVLTAAATAFLVDGSFNPFLYFRF